MDRKIIANRVMFKLSREVESKFNPLKKIKEIKEKLTKKRYKTLDKENAIKFVRDLGKEHYWKYSVSENPEAVSRTLDGVPVIDVSIEDSSKVGDDVITVWFDPILGELCWDYKSYVKSRIGLNKKFRFKPLNIENAVEYVKSMLSDNLKIFKDEEPKEVEHQGYDMVDVPITYGKNNKGYYSVWYDPGHMGLYGEW